MSPGDQWSPRGTSSLFSGMNGNERAEPTTLHEFQVPFGGWGFKPPLAHPTISVLLALMRCRGVDRVRHEP